MKKTIIISIVLVLILFSASITEGAQEAGKPSITFCPENYVAGEETLYLEGLAPAESEVVINLNKDNKEIKKWYTQSNDQGQWSFLTQDLIEGGDYRISVQIRDKEGNLSDPSESLPVKIFLNGLSLGFFLITFKALVYFFVSVLLILLVLFFYFLIKTWLIRRLLKKEVTELRLSLYENFQNLNKQIKKRIEMFDSRPGMNLKERKTYQELEKILGSTYNSTEKEIEDIEKIIF